MFQEQCCKLLTVNSHIKSPTCPLGLALTGTVSQRPVGCYRGLGKCMGTHAFEQGKILQYTAHRHNKFIRVIARFFNLSGKAFSLHAVLIGISNVIMASHCSTPVLKLLCLVFHHPQQMNEALRCARALGKNTPFSG